MGRHTISAGAFFTGSPDISIRCPSHQDEIVLEAKRWAEEREEKGGKLNCFLRAKSDEERDGHLARLVGAQKMHALLLELRDKAKLRHHGKVKEWCVRRDEHPCGMLSFNDKWWMLFWNEKHLSRYGHTKRKELSCIPEQLRDGGYYKYSVEGCLYCNGDYDKVIQEILGLNTKQTRTTEGPWINDSLTSASKSHEIYPS